LTDQITQLRRQYAGDPTMLAELTKQDNRRDLANRILNQKVLDLLRAYAAKNSSSK
jgi:hypothetical protein